MSELSTIARPYAKAVFDLADQDKCFDKWSDVLSLLTNIVADDAIQTLVDDPFVDKSMLAELIKGVCADRVDDKACNLVDTLIDNGRLNAIGDISTRYEELRAEAEQIVEAHVESALPLDDAQLEKLGASLEKHFGKKVKLASSVNIDLMGGILIRAGDTVIDGSVRTKLEKLASTIRA